MTRRKAKTKRIFLSVFLAIALCLFAFAGCQSAGKTPAYGEYLGMNIDECFEALELEPETDMEIIEGPIIRAVLTDPVNYLGKEFSVTLAYTTEAEGRFYNNKLDSVTYLRDYHEVPNEEVAKDAALLFAAILEKYGASGEGLRLSKSITIDQHASGEKIDESDLTEEEISEFTEDIEKISDSIDPYLGASILLELILPEEYEKLDPNFIKEMEEFNGVESSYGIECSLKYREGHFAFSVKHSFERLNDNGLR